MTNQQWTWTLLIIPAWAVALWLAGLFEKRMARKVTNRKQAIGYGILSGCAGGVAWLFIAASLMWALASLATGELYTGR